MPSECVNDWKEVEMASGTYSITKITYVGDNTDIIQSGYSITWNFLQRKETVYSWELVIQRPAGYTQNKRYCICTRNASGAKNIANGLNEGAGESDMSSEESSSIEKEEQDHLTEDSDINSSQKDKQRAYYEKSTRKNFDTKIFRFL